MRIFIDSYIWHDGAKSNPSAPMQDFHSLKLTPDKNDGLCFVAANAVFIFPCPSFGPLAQATSETQNARFYGDGQTSFFGALPSFRTHMGTRF